MLQDRHDLQPAADLPADQRRVVRCSAPATRSGRSRRSTHVTNSSVLLIMLAVIVFLVGLVSEQISALRFEGRDVAGAVDRGARRRLIVAVAVGARAAARLRAALLGRQAADARRARIPGARAQPRARPRASLRDPDEPRPAPRSSSAARPAIPLFLARARRAAARPRTSVPRAVKIAQAVVGALGVWLIGAHRAARPAGPRAGVAAAAIAACYPPLVWMPRVRAQRDAVLGTVALAPVLLLRRRRSIDGATEPPSGATLAGVGQLVPASLAGLAALTRPAMLFFLPLAARRGCARRRRGRRAAVSSSSIALLVVAAVDAAQPSRLSAASCCRVGRRVTFWTGNHPLAAGEGDLAANPRLKRAEHRVPRAHTGPDRRSSSSRSTTASAGVDPATTRSGGSA